MKRIASIIMIIALMLCVLIIPASAMSEKQFYDKWYNDTGWKIAECYYNWNDSGCLGCAGINEEFISAYEYYQSVYPNSKYLAQYANLYKDALHWKTAYDNMNEDMHHIMTASAIADTSGHFGPMDWQSGDVGSYTFYCDDGYVISNVQVSISDCGRLDNLRYDHINFVYWNVEQKNKDGVWEDVYSFVSAVTNVNFKDYMYNFGDVTGYYNSECPWAIIEAFDALS